MKVLVNGRAMDTDSDEYRAWSARRAAFLEAAGADIYTAAREGRLHLGLLTDKVFLEGHANGSQFEHTPRLGDYYKREAEARGQSTQGKVYLSSLAEFPGDPRAWVSGRGDCQRVLEERGWNGRGAVNVKAPPAEGPPPRVAVADDLVEAHAQRAVAADPGLADMDPGELRHEVAKKLQPHWHKN